MCKGDDVFGVTGDETSRLAGRSVPMPVIEDDDDWARANAGRVWGC